MFVECLDGWFYKDPVLHGRGWIMFFEDGEPRVSVRRYKPTTLASGRVRAADRLRSAGVSHMNLSVLAGEVRYFPSDSWLHEAVTYRLRLLAPIPVPATHAGRVESPGDVGRIAFTLPLDVEDLLLMGAEVRGFVLEGGSHPLLGELLAQHPNLLVMRGQVRVSRRSYRLRLGSK